MAWVYNPRALTPWYHSPNPFPSGLSCAPSPALGQARQQSVLSLLCSGENSGSEGEGTWSGLLHSQSLRRPVLKFRCLVQLKSSAELESQDGFFQQRGQRLAAQSPLGRRSGARADEELGRYFHASAPAPVLGARSFHSSLSDSPKERGVV